MLKALLVAPALFFPRHSMLKLLIFSGAGKVIRKLVFNKTCRRYHRRRTALLLNQQLGCRLSEGATKKRSKHWNIAGSRYHVYFEKGGLKEFKCANQSCFHLDSVKSKRHKKRQQPLTSPCAVSCAMSSAVNAASSSASSLSMRCLATSSCQNRYSHIPRPYLMRDTAE